jgi:hypothetical protein
MAAYQIAPYSLYSAILLTVGNRVPIGPHTLYIVVNSDGSVSVSCVSVGINKHGGALSRCIARQATLG